MGPTTRQPRELIPPCGLFYPGIGPMEYGTRAVRSRGIGYLERLAVGLYALEVSFLGGRVCGFVLRVFVIEGRVCGFVLGIRAILARGRLGWSRLTRISRLGRGHEARAVHQAGG